MHLFTNELIKQTSPYLLQHAHNPVNWLPWSEEAFAQAKQENKLVLVSIGYSACHWCHVMEHESFEDEEVATWMNRYFVCIKVDREERPDVDQVYMTAVQLMTQRGGWPLNCFTLPDGKPIYGGTYFQKDQWVQVLKSLEDTYRTKPEEVVEYAEKLKEGVQQSEWITIPEPIPAFSAEKLDELVLRWTHNFDSREGGGNRAPKFPLPNNYEFLLRYGVSKSDEKVLNHVFLTLDKMAYGGIYDQIGGGFCRYSVDVLWKVPHFEKMLYDNAQLVSLYSKAYQYSKNPEYKSLVLQTLDWVEREMTTDQGAFYSALDADSEGVEGKFYTWSEAELKELLEGNFDWFKNYYNVNSYGYWEHDQYILLKKEDLTGFAKSIDMNPDHFELKLKQINRELLDVRNQRIHPGLDNKCLTSWNAMMLKGYVDAYFAFEDDSYLLAALKNAAWIIENQMQQDGTLFHNYNAGKSSIDGFLEDYAHVISAFLRLYEATFDEKYLKLSNQLMQKSIDLFLEPKSSMFYFTNAQSKLIARKMDLNDNVIPASNSVMCLNLIALGTYFQDKSQLKLAEQMVANVYEGMEHYGSGYSNWAMALQHLIGPLSEVCITGTDWKINSKTITREYLPNVLFSGGTSSKLPSMEEKNLLLNQFYVCVNHTCSLPLSDPDQFLESIRSVK